MLGNDFLPGEKKQQKLQDTGYVARQVRCSRAF